MVTSQEFDQVLVPVDYQDNVIMRTFNMLTGFNKKKKGKFMKALKEEWIVKDGKPVFVDRHKEFEEKTANMKKVVLPTRGSKKATAEKAVAPKTTSKEKKEPKPYEGYLLNKIREEKLKNFKDDTDYTVKKMVEYFWKSSKIRERYKTVKEFEDALKSSENLRKKANAKMIEKFGVPEKKTRAVKTAIEKAAAAELETDAAKIIDWFWEHKNDSTYKTLFGNIRSKYALDRMIRNDDRGLKYFANIMKLAGYKKAKEEDKPADKKVVLIKKAAAPEAACDFEREGEAAKEFEENVNDKTFKTILPFFTSWAKEYGIKLTPEAIKAFKEHVFKTIVYHNTMGILHGNN